MLNDNTSEELQEFLIESFNELLPILKAIGTEKRLQILTILLDGAKTFQELSAEVVLARTALSNHLASLINVELIEKIHHGHYRITQKGQEFLQGIAQSLERSQTEEAILKEARQRKQMMDSFLQRNKG